MAVSPHENKLRVALENAPTRPDADAAVISYHPKTDVLTVAVGRRDTERRAEWDEGFLTQRIHTDRPLSWTDGYVDGRPNYVRIDPVDRVEIAVAEPRAVVGVDSPESEALRRLIGPRLYGATAGLLESSTAADRTTITVPLDPSELTQILTDITPVLNDVRRRHHFDFNHHVGLLDEVGVAHDPLLSPFAQLVLREGTVTVAGREFTAADVEQNAESRFVTDTGFPITAAYVTVADINTPEAPNSPGDLRF